MPRQNCNSIAVFAVTVCSVFCIYDPTVRTVPRLGLLEMLLTFLRRLVWRLWYVVAGVVLVVLTALTAPAACLMPTLKTHLKDFRQLLLTDTSEI